MNEKNVQPATIAAQALGWVDDATRGIVAPIHTSTTYIRDPDNQYRTGRTYARDHNPTFDQAEAVITALEGGHASLLFASGMAAATAVFQDNRAIRFYDCYAAERRLRQLLHGSCGG